MSQLEAQRATYMPDASSPIPVKINSEMKKTTNTNNILPR